MLKKTTIIILTGFCAIIIASALCYAVFVKQESVKPIVDNDNVIENEINKDDITKDWKVYANEEYGYEIKYPKDWKVSDGFCPIVFAPKNNPAYTVSVNYSYLTTDNLDIDKEIEYYKNKGTFISEFKVENGACIKFKAQTKGGEIPAAFMIGKNHTIYINYEAFGTFSNDEYNQYKKVYDQMLSTFKFIEPINTSDWQVYRNEEFGFEIKYPGIYSVEDISKTVIGDDPTKYPWYLRTEFALNYVIFDEYPTLKGGVAFDLKILNTIDEDKIKSAGGWEFIKENGIKKIGDLNVHLYSIDSETNNMQVIFHNGKAYTFFHYLLEEDFNQILSTFKFIES